MKKTIVRLTEQDLHHIIKKCLNEAYYGRIDINLVDHIQFRVESEPDEEEIKEEFEDEEDVSEQDIQDYVEENTIFQLECYDSDYEHLGWLSYNKDEIYDEFGEDIAEYIWKKREGRVDDILDSNLNSIDLNNVEEVNAMAKSMFPSGGESSYLLVDGDIISMPDHCYISRIDGMTKAKFVSLGNIRLGSGGYGHIDIMKLPTNAQMIGIKQYCRQYESMEVNFCEYREGDKEPHVEHQARYEDANPSRIVNDIYYYYTDGIKP
jgi:hypothetical protein